MLVFAKYEKKCEIILLDITEVTVLGRMYIRVLSCEVGPMRPELEILVYRELISSNCYHRATHSFLSSLCPNAKLR